MDFDEFEVIRHKPKAGKTPKNKLLEHKEVNEELEAALEAFNELTLDARNVIETFPQPVTRIVDLHPSSFGHMCILNRVMETLTEGFVFVKQHPVMAQRFYTSCGTEVHELTQDAYCRAHRLHGERLTDSDIKALDKDAAKAKKKKDKNKLKEIKDLKMGMVDKLNASGFNAVWFVGDHHCKKCGHVHYFSKYPDKCDKCDNDDPEGFKYEECAVSWGKNITGHTDGLIFVGKKDKKGRITGNLYVVDFKTCTKRAYDTHLREGNYFPYKYNTVQISYYVAMLRHNFPEQIKEMTGGKGDIIGWMLSYITRDNFHNVATVGETMSKKEIKDIEDELDRFEISWQAFRDLENLDNVKGYKNKRKTLIKNKPCSCYEDYEENLKGPYFECPWAEDGSCFDKKELVKTFDTLATEGKFINLKNID